MGISFSCPFAAYSDIENGFESITVKAISFGDNEVRTPLRSISFKSLDSKATILQSVGSGNMIIEGSVRLETRENETMVSVEAPPTEEKDVCVKPSGTDATYKDNQLPRLECAVKEITQLPILDASSPKHEAAIKLQKVYKSFRTRRKLADCAVLIEQSWWKLLDFAELKRSSISFFDIEKHETAVSRWSRARTRAAKVGKGLSKNGRAQKLALQHWLEAIDPRHRYGHNLQFYYTNWLHCQSKEPFFYWLDIGEGKEVNLVDKCPRSKLHLQCIKYLGPMERKAYEVVLEDGKLYYKQTGELLDTTGPLGVMWIFVLSTSTTLYVGKKIKGTFQHSSFLAGGATSAAGRLVVEKGILKAVWPHSGHYRPTTENFQDFISFLKGNHVDLTDVKMDPVEEEEEVSFSKQRSAFLKVSASEDDLSRRAGLEMEEMDVEDLASWKTNSTEETASALEPLESTVPNSLGIKLRDLRIPERDDFFESFDPEDEDVESNINRFTVETPVDGYETADDSFDYEEDLLLNQNLPDEETNEEVISQESILKRIDSHKGMKSYQLGKQLSSKWSTGAGPRIGCVRDYPSKLQFHALEQVNLSPRSASRLRSCFSPRPPFYGGKPLTGGSSPTADRANLPRRNIRHLRTQSSPLCKATLAIATPSES